MEVNLKRPFVDNYGEAVCELRKGVPEITEIGRQVSKLLFNLSTLGGVPLDADQKYEAYRLCQRITAAPEKVELTAEDVVFLKRVCGEQLSAGAYGQVCDILENRVKQ